MSDPFWCERCQLVTSRHHAASYESWTSEFGQVERENDACTVCGHTVLERLSGPGARAWVEAQVPLLPSGEPLTCSGGRDAYGRPTPAAEA